MKGKKIVGCFMMGFLLLCAGGTYADELDDTDSLRCGDGLISVGDPKFSVQEKCGEPTAKEQMGTIWIYNFGPSRYVYYITFDDEQVYRIQTGEYGQ